MSDTEFAPQSLMKTGLRGRCPRCGKGTVFKGYLGVAASCSECGLDYGFADPADGPAFFVMSIVGVVGMILFMVFEFTVHPPIWVHFVFTFPAIMGMALALLRPVKGVMISAQYRHKASEARF